MSVEVIAALNAEITKVQESQEPARAQIAELERSLQEGDEAIARNRAAIGVLSGVAPLPAASRPRPRSRPASSGPSAPSAAEVSKDRIVDYLGAHPDAKAPDIADAIGIGGPPLTKALGEMVGDGIVTKTGEKRGTRYTLKGA